MQHIKRPGIMLLTLLSLILAACGLEIRAQGDVVETPTPDTSAGPTVQGTPLPGNLDQVVFIEDGQEYTIRQILPRDGIRPVYNPRFTDNPAAYDDDELVMGVAINGDARAYPVGYLRSREMVNDTIGGTPVLVSW